MRGQCVNHISLFYHNSSFYHLPAYHFLLLAVQNAVWQGTGLLGELPQNIERERTGYVSPCSQLIAPPPLVIARGETTPKKVARPI